MLPVTMLKASEQKMPVFHWQIFVFILHLSFMFCETKGMKERRPNTKSDDLEEERAGSLISRATTLVFILSDIPLVIATTLKLFFQNIYSH
jgi:hypothetical protein